MGIVHYEVESLTHGLGVLYLRLLFGDKGLLLLGPNELLGCEDILLDFHILLHGFRLNLLVDERSLFFVPFPFKLHLFKLLQVACSFVVWLVYNHRSRF